MKADEIIKAIEDGTAALEAMMSRAVADDDLPRILALWHRAKDFHKRLDAAKKALGATVQRFDRAAIPDMFDARESDYTRLPELARSFYLQQKWSATQVDKEKGFEWLRAQGHGDMIVETVHAQTLTAYLTQRLLDDGVEAPEGTFSLTSYRTIGSSKYTPKPGAKVEFGKRK